MAHNQNGLSGTRLYRIYRSMLNRCYKEYDKFYKDYGGRGIRVCDEWLGENGFLNFHQWAMGHGYQEGLSIERTDVNGNYEPSNCCWITMSDQQRNRRSNVYVDHNGEKVLLADLSKATGIGAGTIRYRMQNGKDILTDFERKKAVIRDDGVIYESIRDAGKANGVHESRISAVCRGVRKRTAGHSFQFLTKEEAEQALKEMGCKNE